MTSARELRDLLQQRFGLTDFRPGQEQTIQTLLKAQRVLCIQPTGYGKSLLYQLPAVLLDGMTLVISPLLALMRDQVHQLENRFGINAASINSDQSFAENEDAQARTRSGALKILFVAPERLDQIATFEFLMGLPIALVVIDEAHCISTWGHDFRPAYRQITEFVRRLSQKKQGEIRVLALTATANQQTQTDITEQLETHISGKLTVIRSAMDRPNIRLAVHPLKGLGDKLAFLAQLVKGESGCTLLYCATRDQTEVVASYLIRQSLDAHAYHAGLGSDQKRDLQHRFLNGSARIIAATNALGMGIDKPDIRLIVHVDMPGSITAYYQEVGRAGRDGLPSRGILLFDESDRKVQEYFIKNAQPGLDDFRMIQEAVAATSEGLRVTDIRTRTGLHPTRVNVVLAELGEQGFVEKHKSKASQVFRVTGKPGKPELVRYERQNRVRHQELNQMLSYGRSDACLMRQLRHALGDETAGDCGRCASCNPADWKVTLQQPDSGSAWSWLAQRDLPIAASKRPPMAAGQSVLAAELGSPWFKQFMRMRSQDRQLPNEILDFILSKVQALSWSFQFGAVVAVPSKTWAGREIMAKIIAEHLSVPGYCDELYWKAIPKNRQGELKNHDQRRANVRYRMAFEGALSRTPRTAVLLLDDYLGSGATMKEAGRVLSDIVKDGPLVPFTIARVRWRMGATGMVVR